MVQVMAGDSKGQQGKVLEVQVAKSRAIVEGVNLVSKHTKPDAKNPQGGIVKKEAPIQRVQVLKAEDTGSDGSVSATRRSQKVGRNDPCPCGSGKKYKKCCGQ